MNDVKFGLGTFGDVTHGPGGVPLPYADVIRNVVAEAVLADEVGVDAVILGEHHRDDFAISTPETILAAIAAKTSRILLSSGVTVLSSDDPIRVFQRFATLDALSEGRAEVIVGRGSFTESFPLFGYKLEDYQVLFEEKLNLFTEFRKHCLVSQFLIRKTLTSLFQLLLDKLAANLVKLFNFRSVRLDKLGLFLD